MKRIAVSIAAAGVVCAMSWLLGFDFNERGLDAFLTAYIAICVGGLAYLSSVWWWK